MFSFKGQETRDKRQGTRDREQGIGGQGGGQPQRALRKHRGHGGTLLQFILFFFSILISIVVITLNLFVGLAKNAQYPQATFLEFPASASTQSMF